MRSTILTLAVVLLLAAGQAFAKGGSGGTWELGGFGGYAWLDDYDGFQPEDGFLYGGRLGYFFTHRWNLEFSAQRIPTDTDYEIVGVPNDDVHLTAYRANLLYNMGTGGFRPFLTAGLGSEKFSVDNWGHSRDLGWNAGIGFRAYVSPAFNIRADGKYVRTKVGETIDDSQGNIEATLGFGLQFGGGGEETHAEVVTPPNQPPTVSCAADRAQILPGETANITATGNDPEGGPLVYVWTVSTGRVTGSGATATLDFTGVTPPSSATVTVRATDDHGNAATSDCSVSLIQPAKPAEAVSCIAGGFPRNAARISNVDKACLDDVAQRLSADPRARVVVIGHSDTKETTANIGQRRADAIKDYLVKERSIDGTRITTRSAPADAGADAGAQASNRRVVVWFVPEGATVPE